MPWAWSPPTRATFRRLLTATSGARQPAPPSAPSGFLAPFADPERLPGWLTEDDVDIFVEAYARNGFTGGLN